VSQTRIKSAERSNGAEQDNGTAVRPAVKGKFIFIGDEKFHIRGVTYGTFSPREDGGQFPPPEMVDKDFCLMRENNINCVRVYTPPPRWLLDRALEHGLRVMVGLPWEQHVAFLENDGRAEKIELRLREEVRKLGRHPAILMYAVGNEIPPTIVRWYGRGRVEDFLKRLNRACKEEDPDGLVTYVNFPTTEYLKLDFFDVMSFNVYLEKKEVMEAYLARLQNMTNDRPLVMAEIGLDTRRNGVDKQAEVLDWQIRSVFAAGSAGIFIFSWTDEWYRGGREIDDWDFGLTARDRESKPALAVVSRNFSAAPFPGGDINWPRISVFVCSYNGSRTIRKTLAGLKNLNYPDYEIVVVNDGSTDRTPEIAGEFNVRVISTGNRGLSAARNEALKDEAADIVAYIDDDAYPDPDWLKYIAYTFLTTDVMAVGGPNLLPLESGIMENCVGNAPGGPTHVLLHDRVAEHIPGCNMAYRKAALKAIGGFDSQFRSAGDDVDVCWRIQEAGWTIGYHPAAFVWHNRRHELNTYWKQQVGYGKAEGLLEDKWPAKYNAVGHIPWSGRVYGAGLTVPLFKGRWRVYHGTWGSAPFQSLYEPAPGILFSLPLMPEWYILILFLGFLSFCGIFWAPLLVILPFFTVSVTATLLQAIFSSGRARFTIKNPSFTQKVMLYGITSFLHVAQPLARLRGRIAFGLTPFKCRGPVKFFIPRSQTRSVWQEQWQSPENILTGIKQTLLDGRIPYHHGGPYDNWDIEVRGGLLGAARFLMTVEEHGEGKQMLRFRISPNYKPGRNWISGVFIILAGFAAFDKAWGMSAILGAMGLWLFMRMLKKCAYSQVAINEALKEVKGDFFNSGARTG
jgi:cellulose synthase/poly-beta-1,6-N-acetylglucosamine synthase-like glycosyltransferase